MTKMTWPERLERNVSIVEAYADGTSVAAIAERLGMARRAVLYVLEGADVDTSLSRTTTPAERTSPFADRDAAIRAARARGETLRSLANRFHLSKQRVSKISNGNGKDAQQ